MRLAAYLVFVMALTAAPAVDTFDARVMAMHRHWDRFVRQLWGCEHDTPNRRDCNITLAKTDRKEFNAACNSAKDLFQLEGRCE